VREAKSDYEVAVFVFSAHFVPFSSVLAQGSLSVHLDYLFPCYTSVLVDTFPWSASKKASEIDL
jgi:hypothetical protein